MNAIPMALGYYVQGVFLVSLGLSSILLLVGAYGLVRAALKAVRS